MELTLPSILFLTRSLNIGGAERQLVATAIGLARRGHRVTVVTFYPGGALASSLHGEEIELVDLGKKGTWDLPRSFLRLVRCIRSRRPDVVYSFLGSANLLSGFAAPFTRGIGKVWSIRASNVDLNEYAWHTRLGFKIECLLSRTADLIISNSESGVEYAASRGFPRKRMVVVPNGIDTTRFRPDRDLRRQTRAKWGIGDAVTLVGTLARIDPMKDHRSFVVAAGIVARKKPDVRFAIVGGGDDALRAELQSLAADLGLEDRLLWVEATESPEAALNAFDIYCSSSAWGEGFSNSVAEAMACDVLPVVTDVGDSARIVGPVGWVSPARDPDSLAENLLEAIAERLEPSPARRPRDRIETHFSVDALIGRTLSAITLSDVSSRPGYS